jgi:hypothetical protein
MSTTITGGLARPPVRPDQDAQLPSDFQPQPRHYGEWAWRKRPAFNEKAGNGLREISGLPSWARHQSSAKQGYADSASTTADDALPALPLSGVGAVSDLALAPAVECAPQEMTKGTRFFPVVGAVVGLALGILVSVATDVPFAPEIGLILGALVGWGGSRADSRLARTLLR